MVNKAPIDGYVDPNIPNPNREEDAPIIIYGYTPTLALSALALALYTLLLLLHILPLLRPRKTGNRPFTILTLVAIIFEIIGYAFRLQSSPPPVGDPYKTINFIIQYFFIVVAPVFLSAGIYTILTSLILCVGVSPVASIPRRGIVWVFVVCDVVATIVQVAGAALIGVKESRRQNPDTANHILLGGLAFQVFSFLLFLVLLGVFLSKAWGTLDHPTAERYGNGVLEEVSSEQGEPKPDETLVRTEMGKSSRKLGGLKAFVAMMTVAALLVYLRTIFRLAETAQGVMGYASSHEAFFGALEFAPVVLAIALLGIWHPGRYLSRA